MLTSAVRVCGPSVMPKPARRRARPRSTVSVLVHWLAHQAVSALPSTAFAAGVPAAGVVAAAVPPSATFSCSGAGAAPAPGALASAANSMPTPRAPRQPRAVTPTVISVLPEFVTGHDWRQLYDGRSAASTRT